MHDIKGAKRNQAFRFTLNGLSVEIAGHHDLNFDFFSVKSRDEVSSTFADAFALRC